MQQKFSLLQSGGDTPWFLMSFTYISIFRNLIFVGDGWKLVRISLVLYLLRVVRARIRIKLEYYFGS
jgi:hypothetical protein